MSEWSWVYEKSSLIYFNHMVKIFMRCTPVSIQAITRLIFYFTFPALNPCFGMCLMFEIFVPPCIHEQSDATRARIATRNVARMSRRACKAGTG